MQINDLEKLRFSSKEELFAGIDPNAAEIRHNERGCFDESLWNNLLGPTGNDVAILEMGTWYGYGAINLAKKIKSVGKNPKIVCVDTWLGSPEHLIDFPNTSTHSKSELCFKNGYPSFYFKFLETVKYFNAENEIIPFPNTTTAFLNVARVSHLSFDFVIIDASHQYEDVKIDLEIAWELVKSGGTIIGDDLNWPGVSKALFDFEKTSRGKVSKTPHQYLIKK